MLLLLSIFAASITISTIVCSDYIPHNSTLNSTSHLHKDHLIWYGRGQWNCGDRLRGAIQCKEDTLLISRCNCMYYNSETLKTEYGTCLYSCFNPQPNSYIQVKRHSVNDYSTFNREMCDRYDMNGNVTIMSNRAGRFCGRCSSGHGLAVYSYHLSSCIPCTYSHWNWVKFICVALLPLTGFYCLVALFGINLAAGKMNGLIFFIQIAMSPFNLYMIDAWMHSKLIENTFVLKVVIALLGPVNLDFFRDSYPLFCISPHFNVQHIIALDYLVALYPFLLIILTYTLIKMYDRDYSCIVWAWKPFNFLVKSKRIKRTSLVETFCTFILLSSIKILSVSVFLLTKTIAYDESGKLLREKYLYLDASIELFSSEHRHFGLLAIFISFTFVVLPFLLLLLYPCKLFQRVLNLFGGRCYALHVFMDAFQGIYRTNPTDLRYFSAYYLLIRFILQFLSAYFQSFFILSITTVVLMISSIVFVVVKPYKNMLHNQIDILCLLFLTLLYASITFMHTTFYLDITKIMPADVAFISSLSSVVIIYFIMLSYALFGQNLKSIFLKIQLRLTHKERNGTIL